MKWTRDQCVAFYNSKEWRKKRKEIRARDHNECQWCRKKGKAVFGGSRDSRGRKTKLYVHHIRHLEDHPELGLIDWNLVTLCYDCHAEAHPERAKKMVEKNQKDVLKYSEELKERW